MMLVINTKIYCILEGNGHVFRCGKVQLVEKIDDIFTEINTQTILKPNNDALS